MTATSIEIAALGAEKSRITLTAVGFRPGLAYDELYKHFRWGDAYTLDKLRLYLETGPSSAPVELKEVKDFDGKKGGP